MARIKFDEPGERLYETGVDACVLYVMGDDGEYEDGVAWNGISSIEENPSGAEETPVYADNIKYLSLRSREEWGATINAYMYPDAFEECDGSKTIVTGMVAGQQSRRQFALVYKTRIGNDLKAEDYGYKLHIAYGCSASVSSRSHNSINDTPEAGEMSWEIKSNPIKVEDIPNVTLKPLSTLTFDSTAFTESTIGKLNTVIDNLYGKDPTTGTDPQQGIDPHLLTPKQIYDILTAN